jgi:hypothetical protein
MGRRIPELFVGKACVEQGCTSAFGETYLTGAAIEQVALAGSSVSANGQITVSAFAAVGIVKDTTEKPPRT